jgi:uncharacterized integral membrane protein
MNDNAVADHAGAVHRRDAARLIRFALALAVVIALVLIGFDNREKVRVGYVFGHAQVPVWAVVLGSALAGIVVAALARSRRR